MIKSIREFMNDPYVKNDLVMMLGGSAFILWVMYEIHKTNETERILTEAINNILSIQKHTVDGLAKNDKNDKVSLSLLRRTTHLLIQHHLREMNE